ncbi:DNA-binding response regulator, OmpR family, contains REC and winged-helix (wHTH) domain [Nakamurella panacisegetis]|uniref:DNA-binding response regulator, OmpR family, contains REC and winged-helix (WHTH) domain n=1 Tax=Nakamurella panacisegetis TaxID=1090615 RepID=A0A1H0SXX5_9ACTN|nr:response regulator transcription factor [Nakamurella panacisegetis]SDP46732.1 DNA-binding response regulator, OmpR family, contains REC and winged-helix (wHTH) domain [Nakamurella panacisegetis]
MDHVLVVEDEPSLLLLLSRLLAGAGYQVTQASNGQSALRCSLRQQFDLVILDLMLPDLRGEDVLAELLGSRAETKVLVLSSVTDLSRRVGVLDHGAVDFLAKPFAGAELMARVRARIRHGSGDRTGSIRRYLTGAGLELDLERHELIIDGRRIDLSQREFALLAHLLHRTPAVCTRQELLSDVWGLSFDPGTNVVEVYMRRLRAKLTISRIETVRNVGYRLVAC